VIPPLVRFKDVRCGVRAWVESLESPLAAPRDVETANQCVAQSAYAIANSAAALEAIYAQRAPA
jgi:hypothetical protein